MRRWRTAGPEEGSAALEFLVGSVLLLVPLVYLVLSLAALQSAAFATEGAARGAALLLARAGDDPGAESRVQQAIGTALADFGVPSAGASVAMVCRPEPECGPGGEVMVTVRVHVPLPLLPDSIPAAVPVEGAATLPISRFPGEAA
ncbi:hypothetical protein [Naasia sp. SYSU D00057]|uniref:hypothetical protein n=1 Tax=Naasia sp. SYSU D00057 TaxID=2817380 RepID=UPI001B3151B8|nr:hypothetical protein [Naasia sp. SYSU D00057]